MMTKAQLSARAKKIWIARKANAAAGSVEKQNARKTRGQKAAATRKANREAANGPVRGTSLSPKEKMVIAVMRRRELNDDLRIELIRVIMEGL